MKKWYGSYDGIPSGYWTQNSGKMQLNFKKSGHPIFRCTCALEEGQLRNKEGGKTTIHFTAYEENVQLLLKVVMSVNQHSLHGAIADMIQGLREDQVAPGRPVASDQTEQEKKKFSGNRALWVNKRMTVSRLCLPHVGALSGEPSILEETEQVVVLAVDVFANLQWRIKLQLQEGLLAKSQSRHR